MVRKSALPVMTLLPVMMVAAKIYGSKIVISNGGINMSQVIIGSLHIVFFWKCVAKFSVPEYNCVMILLMESQVINVTFVFVFIVCPIL